MNVEGLSYQDVLAFCGTWGVVYFGAMLVLAFAYALWPSNRKRFDEAAQVPLRDDGES
jgi:cytochrome c oxidase cbb3-type subunit 4